MVASTGLNQPIRLTIPQVTASSTCKMWPTARCRDPCSLQNKPKPNWPPAPVPLILPMCPQQTQQRKQNLDPAKLVLEQQRKRAARALLKRRRQKSGQ